MTDQDKATAADTAEPSTGSRALVVIQDRLCPSYGDERPQADFLTQLIACERRLPAYRQARNADPDAAMSAYSRSGGGRQARLDCVV